MTGTVIVLARLAGGMVRVPLRPGSRCRPWRCRRRWRTARSPAGGAAERVTVKVAARVPALPSVTVTSPILSVGGSGGAATVPDAVVEQHRDGRGARGVRQCRVGATIAVEVGHDEDMIRRRPS